MLYQLPNGRVVEMSTEQFVEMTDEELEYLIAYNYGEVVENPWQSSVLSKQPPIDIDDIVLPDLTEIPDDDKINFTDIDFDTEDY